MSAAVLLSVMFPDEFLGLGNTLFDGGVNPVVFLYLAAVAPPRPVQPALDAEDCHAIVNRVNVKLFDVN
jgi:hypothetical protein